MPILAILTNMTSNNNNTKGEAMKVHEIKNAITDSVTPGALEYFNGMCDELVNELVILAQRESVEAAAIELEIWSTE